MSEATSRDVFAAAERGDVHYLIGALVDPQLRLFAAARLGDLRAEAAVPALMRNLRAHNDLDRNAAVIALGRIATPEALNAIATVAEEDEAAGVRITAAEALARNGDPRGTRMLVACALDPRAALGSASRAFKVPLSWMRVQDLRPKTFSRYQRWATKKLRELQLDDATPDLREALPSLPPIQRLRIRWTIRAIERAKR